MYIFQYALTHYNSDQQTLFTEYYVYITISLLVATDPGICECSPRDSKGTSGASEVYPPESERLPDRCNGGYIGEIYQVTIYICVTCLEYHMLRKIKLLESLEMKTKMQDKIV